LAKKPAADRRVPEGYASAVTGVDRAYAAGEIKRPGPPEAPDIARNRVRGGAK